MAPAAPSTQLSPSSAVTIFAVNGEGMQEQKSRQPAGGKSSFSPNALGEILRYLIDLSKGLKLGGNGCKFHVKPYTLF
jgi:hypothetical protein